jgi:hypothetical protein
LSCSYLLEKTAGDPGIWILGGERAEVGGGFVEQTSACRGKSTREMRIARGAHPLLKLDQLRVSQNDKSRRRLRRRGTLGQHGAVAYRLHFPPVGFSALQWHRCCPPSLISRHVLRDDEIAG